MATPLNACSAGERFGREAVEARGPELAGSDGREERRLVDETAARRVDEDRAVAHAADGVGVDHAPVLGRQRTMERQDMRSLDDGIEGGDLDPAGNLGCERVERDDAHAHRNADLGGAAADRPETDEPERASLQLQALVGGLVPMPVMHAVVELCDALGAGQDQGPGVLGHGIGIRADRRLDGDPALRRGRGYRWCRCRRRAWR